MNLPQATRPGSEGRSRNDPITDDGEATAPDQQARAEQKTWPERIASASDRAATYHAYLASPEWAKRRTAALRRAKGRCQLCNNTKRLQVHHRTYDRIGEERADDLTVLCRPCHKRFHKLDEPAPRRRTRPCPLCKKNRTRKRCCGECRRKGRLLSRKADAMATQAAIEEELREGGMWP